jgi:hypothetical protein
VLHFKTLNGGLQDIEVEVKPVFNAFEVLDALF